MPTDTWVLVGELEEVCFSDRYLAKEVGVGLAVEQQLHYIEVAVEGGHKEGSEPGLYMQQPVQ